MTVPTHIFSHSKPIPDPITGGIPEYTTPTPKIQKIGKNREKWPKSERDFCIRHPQNRWTPLPKPVSSRRNHPQNWPNLWKSTGNHCIYVYKPNLITSKPPNNPQKCRKIQMTRSFKLVSRQRYSPLRSATKADLIRALKPTKSRLQWD